MSTKELVAKTLAKGGKAVAKPLYSEATRAALAARARKMPVAAVDEAKYNPVRDPKLNVGEEFIVPVTGDTANRSISGKAVLVQKPKSVSAQAVPYNNAEMRRVAEMIGGSPVKTNLYRVTNTDIYKTRPDQVAAAAAAKVAPESPMLHELFGVTRKDLRDMDFEMARNYPSMGFYDVLPNASRRPRANPIIEELFSGKNAQRLVDTLGESMKYEGLADGMLGWYQMQPLYDRFKQLWGSDAPQRFREFNAFTGMASSGSDVATELNRGSGAYMGHVNPDMSLNDFIRYGGNSANARPDWMKDISGHPFHSTAHTTPMSKFVESGAVDMDSGKVPSYIAALGVPDTGFQRIIPIADAHFARASGLPDIRANWSPDLKNATVSEMQALTAPYTNNIAAPLGLNPVQAQALQWGAYSPYTGVETLIGAPKLEILADLVRKTAQRTGMSPNDALNEVIMGRQNLGEFNPNTRIMGDE